MVRFPCDCARGSHEETGDPARHSCSSATVAVMAGRARRARPRSRAKQAKLEKQAAEKRQKEADLWVARTMAKMTLDEKIGQLIFSSINAAYLSTDSEEYERLLHLVRDLKVGGFHVFGSAEALPQVMLNPVWGRRQRVAQGRSVRGGGAPEPAPVGVGDPAADVGRLRGRRGLHPQRRHAPAARDGHRRHRRRRSWPSRPAWSAPPRRAPSASTSTSTRSSTSTTTRATRSSTSARSARIPALVSRMARRLHQGHPVDRRLRHGEALPGPRRHERRHAPRPRGHQPPARAPRPGGTGAVQGRHRRRRRRGDVHRTSSCRPSTRRRASRPRSAARSSPACCATS